MYVEVAHYRLGTGTAEDLRSRVEEGPIATMRKVDGFVGYYAFEAGDGAVASVAIFEDRAGLEEAEQRLGSWIEETVARFEISPGEVSRGEVFASARAED